MKITLRLSLLLLFVSIGYIAGAQQGLKFPISGNYQVVEDAEMTPQRFNKVSVENTVFTLFQDAQSLQTFKLISFYEGGYDVEQYFVGDDIHVVRDKKRFSIRFDQISEQECFITILYPERTDKIHLTKSAL